MLRVNDKTVTAIPRILAGMKSDRTWRRPALKTFSIAEATRNNFGTRIDNQCSGVRGRRGFCP